MESEGMDVLVYAMTGCGLQGWISSMDLGALVLLCIEVILYLDAVMVSTANDGFMDWSTKQTGPVLWPESDWGMKCHIGALKGDYCTI
jgi:hypothetical protein